MTDVITYAKDLAERAGWTFVQAASSTFAAAQLGNFNELKSAAIAASVAGGASVLSLVKGVLAGTRTGSASTLKHQAVSAAEDAGVAALNDAIQKAASLFPESGVKVPNPASVVDYSKNPNNL